MVELDATDTITPTEAARLRRDAGLSGSSIQWILSLMRRKRIKTIEIGGRKFVSKKEVLSYEGQTGRPSKRPSKKKK